MPVQAPKYAAKCAASDGGPRIAGKRFIFIQQLKLHSCGGGGNAVGKGFRRPATTILE